MLVFPVWRSPIINSLCPLPMGIMASIAFSPVCKGSVTGCLKITPGALRSRGISIISPLILPFPSIGSPSGLMTLPNKDSPTLIDATRLVLRAISPSFTLLVLPNNTAPTLSSSRFITMAFVPFSNSISSLASTLFRPYKRTTPSLTCKTRPISSNCTSESICCSCKRSKSETSLTFILSFMSSCIAV